MHCLTSDASKRGWGATFGKAKAGGQWSEEESELHINVLKLEAVLFDMESLVRMINTQVKILSDNTTTVRAINKMCTSHSDICNQVANEISDLAIAKDIWISATRLPGKYNVEADEESRKEDTQLERKLSEQWFTKLCSALSFKPEVDLFASRINRNHLSHTDLIRRQW